MPLGGGAGREGGRLPALLPALPGGLAGEWRLERLLHAEAAGLAWQRTKFENDHCRKEASEGVGIRAGFEQITSHEAGYSALPESEGKYELILLLLYTLVVEAQADGYTETGAQCLRVLYGPKPGLAKQAFLIDEYNALPPRSKRRRETQEYQYQRQQFLGKLKEEISNFKTQRDCLRTERSTLFDMERDSLLLGEKATKIVAREETRLRNYLQQTFKQLMTWRQKSGQEGPRGSASGRPSGHPGSPPKGRRGTATRGGEGAPSAAAPSSPPSPNGDAEAGEQRAQQHVPTAQADGRAPAGVDATPPGAGEQTRKSKALAAVRSCEKNFCCRLRRSHVSKGCKGVQLMARSFARREESRSFGRRGDLRMTCHSEGSEESALGCGQQAAL